MDGADGYNQNINNFSLNSEVYTLSNYKIPSSFNMMEYPHQLFFSKGGLEIILLLLFNR